MHCTNLGFFFFCGRKVPVKVLPAGGEGEKVEGMSNLQHFGGYFAQISRTVWPPFLFDLLEPLHQEKLLAPQIVCVCVHVL